MKKNLLVCFLVLATTFTSLAQADNRPFQFGIQLAPNLGWLSPDTKGYNSDGIQAGFSWGFVSDIAIAQNYYFNTGFNLNYLNGKMVFDSQITTNGDTTLGTMHRKFNMRYLEIPLQFKMKTNTFGLCRFWADIGFVAGINIKAKSSDNFVSEAGKVVSTEDDAFDDISTARLALQFGIGVDYLIDKSTFLFAGIHFNNGLTNVMNGVNPRTRETQRAVPNYLALSVGIMF